MRYRLLSLFLVLPAVAGAQGGAGVSAVHETWKDVTAFVARAAEQMPEADYAYRPAATVRTFGQLVGHVAGSQKLMCAAALGEPAGNEDDVEKSATTKQALVAAMRATTAYCERAYAQSDAAVTAKTTLFGQQVTRMYALSLNATHNGEHYGNIVTYLRLKGIVPPSSEPRK